MISHTLADATIVQYQRDSTYTKIYAQDVAIKISSIKVCTEIEAEYDRALLEEYGVRVVVVPYSEAAVLAVGGGFGMVELLVREEDADRALALLKGASEARAAPTLAEISELVSRQIASGEDPEHIVEGLVERGWSEGRARHLVRGKARMLSAHQAQRQPVQTGMYVRRIVWGLFKTLLGVGLTAGTYAYAAGTGGVTIFFWGLIGWGLVDLIIGINGWLKNR